MKQIVTQQIIHPQPLINSKSWSSTSGRNPVPTQMLEVHSAAGVHRSWMMCDRRPARLARVPLEPKSGKSEVHSGFELPVSTVLHPKLVTVVSPVPDAAEVRVLPVLLVLNVIPATHALRPSPTRASNTGITRISSVTRNAGDASNTCATTYVGGCRNTRNGDNACSAGDTGITGHARNACTYSDAGATGIARTAIVASDTRNASDARITRNSTRKELT